MAHPQQAHFCASVREKYPNFFSGSFVLDIGSLDINGNNQFLFDNDCLYIGLDLAPGKNVDLVTPAHQLVLPDATFDVIISTECLEHDRFYIETLKNIVRLLKPGGLFLMSCATTGRPEHGTLRTTPQDAPLLNLVDIEWANYYKNITEIDIRSAVDIEGIFNEFSFSIGHETHDIYFYGIKRGNHIKRRDVSWLLESSPRNIKITSLHNELDAVQAENRNLHSELDAVQAENRNLHSELDAVQAKNRNLHNELDAVQAENRNLHSELDALFRSKSWRITHPLRLLMTHAIIIRQYTIQARNALRYIRRGDVDGLMRRVRTIKAEKNFEILSKGGAAKIWCVLATPHTLFIANLIASRLLSYGWGVEIRTTEPDNFEHEMYIVLCPQMFSRLPPGEKRISFQLEQSVSSRWFNDEYFRILENSLAVFDYSLTNIDFLSGRGIAFPHVFYIPIGAVQGYMPQQAPVPKKYDVLFYGDAASSPRRQKMLAAIRKKFNLRECSEIFAEEMANEIRSERLVLNIHYYENAILETPRIMECLSLGVPVVSESSQDLSDYPEVTCATTFFEQSNEDAMVAAVTSALRSGVDKQNIDTAVSLSAERFEFMFDRALVALGLLPPLKVLEDNLPLQKCDVKITLSMPETIRRRRVYEENKPSGYTIFDGLRARPGWIGCGLSYSALAKHALRQGLKRLTVIEDDVLLSSDFEMKMRDVYAYLDKREGEWDVFAGVVATLHENTEIVKHEVFSGITFLTLNKMTSMVCNVYSERGLRLLASWDHTNRNDQTNTIDKYLERQPGLSVVVALPFLVGHREELDSTLWGFQNSTYASLIEGSEKKLQSMVNSYLNKF